MFGRRIIGIILVLLLIGGLLSLGGYLGWQQGYATGSLAAAGDGGRVVPHAYYGVGFFPLFFGFGLIFKLLFFLFLIFLIAKMFRFWTWRAAGGPPGYGWGRRHWHHHGPPPWYKGERETSEEDEGQDLDNSDDVEKA